MSLARSVQAQPGFEFFEPVQPPRRVQVMAHRGLKMLAPENTGAAILGCYSDFIEWAEVDVRLTHDGQHVIWHDTTVERLTSGTGRVADQTLAQLQQLDAGTWWAPRFQNTRLLSLAELLTLTRGKVNLYLDCKQVDPARLVQEIRAAKMESQVVVYGNPELLAAVRDNAGESIPRMTKFHPRTDNFDQFLTTMEPAAVELDAADVTVELCCAFHNAGVRVQAKVLGAEWDQPAIWDKMITAGVDWLQTDDPVGVRFHEVRRRIGRFPVQIAYHRGANRYAPENTVAAIRQATACGADYVEIDIQTSRDGQFVLLHDRTLNRTTNGQGPVSDQPLEALRRLDAGAWFGKPFAGTQVPLLDEGLAALGDVSRVYLDAKNIPPADLVAATRKHALLERHVVYQSLDYCRKLRELEPAMRLLPPLKTPADFDKVASIQPFGVDAAWSALSAELIQRCHAANVQVFSDALGLHETVADYRQALRWGIDVIQTDHPLRVLRAIELEQDNPQ
ncbi:MAG: glycerophosphodiester phosphodiesterase family protein [Planctomycetes bacterium]|nr:glycerophosphodiester phosphodiesterase family protein [Planctomycetota bacterium]